jgi:hypothetical protein
MKTTELYVEQVFIGFLIILVVLLPWLPEGIGQLRPLASLAQVAVAGSAAIGVAFFIGIPFDRLSDTLVERVDQMHRLSMAYAGARSLKSDPVDFFPEDRLLFDCLTDKSLSDRLEYLRSRIRLTRALAVYGPALTVTAAYAAQRYLLGGKPHHAWIYGVLAASYLAWLTLVLAPHKLPRTEEAFSAVDATEGKWLRRCRPMIGKWELKNAVLPKDCKSVPEVRIWASNWETWIVPVVLLVAALGYFSFSRASPGAASLIAWGGALLTALSAWSWLRISSTYRKFLLDARAFAKGPA